MTRVAPLHLTAASGAAPGSAVRVRSARLLEEDPELGEALGTDAFALAAECARAAVLHVPIGEWRQPVWPTSTTSGFGLLMLDGLLLRRVSLGDRGGVELLAGGDLLRPWQREDSACSVPRQLGWEVLESCRLAVLDVEFAERISSFPQIAGQLMARAMRRSRSFAVNMAIVQQPRVETRVHMLLWHLADRSGTVSPDGVMLPLRLTQGVLAALVAARRPTVNAALGALERDGKLARTSSGWLLRGLPPGGPRLEQAPAGPAWSGQPAVGTAAAPR